MQLGAAELASGVLASSSSSSGDQPPATIVYDASVTTTIRVHEDVDTILVPEESTV